MNEPHRALDFVYEVIKGAGAGGHTCDEIEEATGLSYEQAYGYIRALSSQGKIVESGRRRPTTHKGQAIVWVLPAYIAPMDEETIQPSPLVVEDLPPIAQTSPIPGALAGQSTLFSLTVIDPIGEAGLGPLRKRCLECSRCELSKERQHVVFGAGNADGPDVCFVGEAPGAMEDEKGIPFIGPAGIKLNKIITAMGYTREQVYLCNAVNCRPPGNRTPEPKEMEACYEYLLGQIRAVRPKVIVALGASAIHAMFNEKKKIGELRGKWLEWEGISVMPTFHPSYICRVEREADNGIEAKKLVWADMQMVLTRLGRKTT